MSYYIINLSVIILYSVMFNAVFGIKGRGILAFIICVHLSLIVGLRSFSVGTDTELYENYFNFYSNSNWNSIINFDNKFIGYSIIMKIVSYIGGSYNLFMLLISLFSFSSIYYVLYHLKNVSLSLSTFFLFGFYYFFQSMNTSRNFLALSICILIFYLLEQKKFWVPFLLLIVAVSIHSTAIICIVYFIIMRINWTIPKYVILGILTILILKLQDTLFLLFSRVFTSYTSYSDLTGNFSSQGSRIMLVLFFLILLIYGIIENEKISQKKIVYDLQALLVISIVIGLLYSSNQLLVRVQFYFEIFMILYIPILFYPTNSNKLNLDTRVKFKSLMLIPVILLTLVPFYYQLSSNYGEVIPYVTFFK